MTCHESLFQPLTLQIYKWKLQSVLFLYLLTKFQFDAHRESYDDFPRWPVLSVIQESAKRPTSSDHISENISWNALKYGPKVQRQVFSNGFFLRLLKLHRKKVIAKIPRWPVWSSETLESKALIPNVMKPAQEKIEKIYQCLRIQPLRGGNLLYITWTNNSWMIQMKRPPFYIYESKGS